MCAVALELADLPRVRDLLQSLPEEVDAVSLRLALGEVTELARSLELTAYVALAARRGLSFATVDDRLLQAAASSGVELVA